MIVLPYLIGTKADCNVFFFFFFWKISSGALVHLGTEKKKRKYNGYLILTCHVDPDTPDLV